jgi:PAS domain S-box-containing protein
MSTRIKGTNRTTTGITSGSGPAVADGMLHCLAFNNSLQANIISIESTGKLITVNTAACALLGYSEKELLTKGRASIFNITEITFKKILKQGADEGQPIALLTAVKKSGELFCCEVTSAVFTDNGIEKAITTLMDMTDRMLKQKKIDIPKAKVVSDNIASVKSKQKDIDIRKKKTVAHNILVAQEKSEQDMAGQDLIIREEMFNECDENFKLMLHSSPEVLFDSDLITDKIIISDAFETEFGYELSAEMNPADSWVKHIHPDDKEALMLNYHQMLASDATEWKYTYRFLRADNSIAKVLSNLIIMRNADRKAYRMVGSMQDISKQTMLEDQLDHEIRLKEKQIAEASEDARHTERSDIGKELHDNVNQLLSASRLYLDMAKHGGEKSELYLSRSSEYILLAIEAIRKLTKGLSTDIIKNLGLRDAIDSISRDIMEVNPVRIYCNIEFEEDSSNDRFKINIFRIVQEQLNNIIKHAKATIVNIDLLQNQSSVSLSICDNGVGFNTRKSQKGVGIANIKSRASSYKGIADFISQPGKGCTLNIMFPENKL